ncbi:HslU--HslV peptidase proteolytic subunit, partial [Vibrio cholerae]|nr:HslU--HslV peptidase proteolytic subunit [Vibrio cholerae]
ASEHLTAKQIAKASLEIAGDICVYTNHNIIVEEL